ncbi:Rhodanese-like domain-containing protein 8, chloroplastic [Ancistrocladus abbreviatus]
MSCCAFLCLSTESIHLHHYPFSQLQFHSSGRLPQISPNVLRCCLSSLPPSSSNTTTRKNGANWGLPSSSINLSHGYSSISSSTTTESSNCRSNSSFDAQDHHIEFIVVNFYRFVFISDPKFEVRRHLSFLQDQGLDVCGRIYLNEQGINAQFSGPSKDAMAYVNWLREDQRFSDVLIQISPSSTGHVFPRLKLRYKPSLVQFEGGNLDLPLLDPSMLATPLTPAEWRKRMESVGTDAYASHGDPNKRYILLDVRNGVSIIQRDEMGGSGQEIKGNYGENKRYEGYEWDIGHFDGALRPEVDCFRSMSFGLSKLELSGSDPLANVDKENIDILMYCTGGIRCDVYSTILRQRGFQNLYTLKGGISHYFESEGPTKWIGNLFVFDSRLSLPPSTFKHGSNEGSRIQQAPKNNKFARCYTCGSQVNELRHRNCANLDCNLLFLCCRNCVEELRGCCCSNCKSAPRLRPILPGNQRYKKWHHYRDNK